MDYRTWKSVTRTLGDEKGDVTLVVRDDGAGWGHFWDLWESRTWEPWTTDLMDQLLHPGNVFVDVGAWIGPLSLYAAKALGCRVVCLEPDAIAYSALIDNIERNELQNMDAASVCVTSSRGSFALSNSRGGAFGDSMTYIGGSGPQVPGYTLPEILDDLDISAADIGLVKIDVEGYEVELLPSLGPWLAAEKIPLQFAMHGSPPDFEWLLAYSDVRSRAGEWEFENPPYYGDVVALP